MARKQNVRKQSGYEFSTVSPGVADSINVVRNDNNKSKTNMTTTLTDGYNIIPPAATIPMPTLRVQLNVGDYSAKSAAPINPTLDKAITFLFYSVPLFCFMSIARVLMFVAAIALIVWGFSNGPLWCLVAVFIHFPIAFALLRGTFCSWNIKALTATANS